MRIRKALTFRASSIGDALNAKYLLENIHASYPDARCGLVVAGRGGMIRDLLAAYPWIEVREVNRRDVIGLLRLWWDFRGSDLVVTPSTKPGGRFALPSKIAARLLARPGGLIGFSDASRWSRYIYDGLLPAPATRAPRLLEQDVLNTAEIPVLVNAMRLIPTSHVDVLSRLKLENTPYLVLHLFAGSEGRAISPARRQQLVTALAKDLPHIPLVLTGTVADRPFIDQLALPKTALNVAGDVSIQELSALILGSACMISIGTGPSHMASHLEKALIVLVVCIGRHWCGREQFGDAEADYVFSAVDWCKSGHTFEGLYPACIEHIDIDEVVTAAGQYFL